MASRGMPSLFVKGYSSTEDCEIVNLYIYLLSAFWPFKPF